MTKFGKVKALMKGGFRLSSFLLYPINFALSLVLILAIAFLLCLSFNLKIDLPKSLELLLKEELQKESLVLESKSIKLNFRGNLIIEEPKLRFAQSSDSFFSAKTLKAGLSMLSLFENSVDIDYIALEKAILSSSKGEADSFLSISLNASRRADIWSLKKLRANFGEIKISAQGSLDRRFLAKFRGGTPQAETKARAFYEQWEELCAQLKDIQYFTDSFNKPTFSLDFNVSKNNIKAFNLSFLARDINMDLYGEPLTLESLKLSFDKEKAKSRELNFFAQAKALSYSEDFKARLLKLSGKLSYKAFRNINSFAISDLALAFTDFESIEEKLNYILLSADNLSLKKAPKELILHLEKGDSRIRADAKLEANRIDLELDFVEDPDVFLKIPALEFLKTTKVFSKLTFDKTISIRANSTFFFEKDISSWDLKNLNLENFESLYNIKSLAFLYGRDVRFSNKFIEEVYGTVHFDLVEGDVLIDDIYLQTSENWSLNGTFIQNIHNLDYSILVDGNFEPSCLDGVMAPWWEMVFNNFELLDYPLASVYVKGRWGEPEFTWAYAKVDVSKGKYHDYAFEDISLVVNVNPSIICAYDIDIKGGNGKANACLSWIYDPDFGLEKYLYRTITASVNMNYDAIKALGGEEVEEILDIISFENNIALDFDLYDLNPRRDPAFEQKINFKFDSKDPLKVSYFDFDSIEGEGNAIGQSFYIRNANAKFLDGNLSGDFSLEKLDAKHFFKSNLEVENLNQGKLLALINEIVDREEALDANYFLGEISSSLSAQGFLLDFNSYTGQATLSVENPELKTISILGALSRLLDSMNVPLSTLDFTNLDGEFSLKNGAMSFSKLEIKSETSTVFGKALYTPMTDALSARMYFNWKTSSTIPILGHIADFAFDPILDSVLIVMSNTLTDPSLSLRVRPFNIFNSSETMIDNIDADSL